MVLKLTETLYMFQVPLFQHMDSLVLENICDRVKSLVFPKGEIVSGEFRLDTYEYDLITYWFIHEF